MSTRLSNSDILSPSGNTSSLLELTHKEWLLCFADCHRLYSITYLVTHYGTGLCHSCQGFNLLFMLLLKQYNNGMRRFLPKAEAGPATVQLSSDAEYITRKFTFQLWNATFHSPYPPNVVPEQPPF